MIGKIISHYKILDRLGTGGMGVVYKARDLKLDRLVAIKFLPPQYCEDEDAKMRFVNEAKSASALDHPNIATIHEINETSDGQLYIVMSCYHGETLKQKLSQGPIDINTALNIILQIAEGLDAAHRQKIVHRDIKPNNILITDEGQVKIVDFGLAKFLSEKQITKSGTTLGTVAYMSPEQACGKEIDVRSDIWSLGVVFYEIITGQLPFRGDFDQAIIYAIINEKYKPAKKLRPAIPVAIDRVIGRALKKRPDKRYVGVNEFLSDLRRLSNSPDTGVMNFAEKFKARKKTFIAISFILLLIITISGYIVSSQLFRLDPKKGKTPDEESAWQNSLAVMPFLNISPDPDQEYFSDGMTEQIITSLSRLKNLKVIARTSVMRYKNSSKSIEAIADDLKVAFILEGSVRRYGDRIRVTAQLIDTKNSFHIWTDEYDRKFVDVFAIQDEVSESIASALIKVITAGELSDLKQKRPASTRAYESYLKATYLGYRFDHVPNKENYRNAESMYKEAIELDPDYAPAHAGLAYLYYNYAGYIAKTADEKHNYRKQADRHVKNAMNLDPESAESLLSRAWMHWHRDEWKEVYKVLKKALKISPNHVHANLVIGYTLRNRGLIPNSFKYFDRARKLDPLDPWVYAARGYSFWLMGEIDSAFLEYDKALQLEPNDSETLNFYIHDLLMIGNWREAGKLLDKYSKITPTRDIGVFKSWTLAIQGAREKAIITFENASAATDDDKIILYQLLGLQNKAIDLMRQRHLREKSVLSLSRFITLKNHVFYEPMRRDNRFKKILKAEEDKYPLVLNFYGLNP